METLPKLTTREKGFVRDIASGKSGVAAAKRNYRTSSYGSAAAIASETLRKPRVLEALKTIAEQIPDDKIVRRLNQAIDRDDTEIVYDTEIDNEGNPKTVARKVSLGPSQIAIKALDMAIRLKGAYKDKPKEPETKPTPILANILVYKEAGSDLNA